MLFDNMTIRLLGSDDFPNYCQGTSCARDLTAAAAEGALSIAIRTPRPLARTADAHDDVDTGSRNRVLVAIPD